MYSIPSPSPPRSPGFSPSFSSDDEEFSTLESLASTESNNNELYNFPDNIPILPIPPETDDYSSSFPLSSSSSYSLVEKIAEEFSQDFQCSMEFRMILRREEEKQEIPAIRRYSTVIPSIPLSSDFSLIFPSFLDGSLRVWSNFPPTPEENPRVWIKTIISEEMDGGNIQKHAVKSSVSSAVYGPSSDWQFLLEARLSGAPQFSPVFSHRLAPWRELRKWKNKTVNEIGVRETIEEVRMEDGDSPSAGEEIPPSSPALDSSTIYWFGAHREFCLEFFVSEGEGGIHKLKNIRQQITAKQVIQALQK